MTTTNDRFAVSTIIGKIRLPLIATTVALLSYGCFTYEFPGRELRYENGFKFMCKSTQSKLEIKPPDLKTSMDELPQSSTDVENIKELAIICNEFLFRKKKP